MLRSCWEAVCSEGPELKAVCGLQGVRMRKVFQTGLLSLGRSYDRRTAGLLHDGDLACTACIYAGKEAMFNREQVLALLQQANTSRRHA